MLSQSFGSVRVILSQRAYLLVTVQGGGIYSSCFFIGQAYRLNVRFGAEILHVLCPGRAIGKAEQMSG